MKTLIDLPDDLLNKVMKITKSKTKVEAIKKALTEVVDQDKRMKLMSYRGKIDLDLDLDILRDRKDLLK
jgi:Arc/MetJ family transcription regulator